MVRIHPDPPLTGTRKLAARQYGSITACPATGSKAVRQDRLSSKDGAVAQLGERLLCKQEVVGSIPSSSTSSTRHYRLPETAFKRGHAGAAFLACPGLKAVALFNNLEGKALMDLMRVRQR